MPVFVVGGIALLVLTAMAWVIRAATVAAFSTRHPHAVALVTRHWLWFPVLLIGIVISVALWPIGPLLAAGVVGLVVAKPDLFRLPPR